MLISYLIHTVTGNSGVTHGEPARGCYQSLGSGHSPFPREVRLVREAASYRRFSNIGGVLIKSRPLTSLKTHRSRTALDYVLLILALPPNTHAGSSHSSSHSSSQLLSFFLFIGRGHVFFFTSRPSFHQPSPAN